MRRVQLLSLAAALCAGAAVPALAAWEEIGSLAIPYADSARVYDDIGGPVDSLSLRARDSDIMCHEVVATFANGARRSVFSGVMPRGRDVTVDLLGPNRDVSRLDFDCRSMTPRRAIVDIGADYGERIGQAAPPPDRFGTPPNRYGAPPPDRFGPPPDEYGPPPPPEPDPYAAAGPDRQGWVTLGSRTFQGAFDREATFPGAEGRNSAALGFRPINDDARCSSVTATFRDGRTRELNIDGRNLLRQDRTTTVDLPGLDRNVTRVDMNCHAVHGNRVTMEVMVTG